MTLYVYTFVLLKQVYKVLAHETWTTQTSHIAAFVQQKSSPTYKQLTSYGGSNSQNGFLYAYLSY